MKGEVVIIDAQKRYGAGLKQLLSDHNYDVLEPLEGTLALSDHVGSRTSLVILDYDEEHIDNHVLTKCHIDNPHLKWMLITSINNSKKAINTSPIKYQGYLTKECPDEEIIEAVEEIAKGKQFYCQQIFGILRDDFIDNYSCDASTLTAREVEVLTKVAEGLTEKQIGALMNISHHTVHTHRKNIMKKLNVKSSSEMIAQALKAKII